MPDNNFFDLELGGLDGAAARPRRAHRPDGARGQRRLALRADAPVFRARAPSGPLSRLAASRCSGVPCNQFANQEPEDRGRDPDVLLDHLRDDVPDQREGRRQRSQPPPPLRAAGRHGGRRRPRGRRRLELREVPRLARRRRSRRALSPRGRARVRGGSRARSSASCQGAAPAGRHGRRPPPPRSGPGTASAHIRISS